MMLRCHICSEHDLNAQIKELLEAVHENKKRVEAKLKYPDPLAWLQALKFESFATDPLSAKDTNTNLLEFVNQAWTTIATYLALKHLYSLPQFRSSSYKLNLGTRDGIDIISFDNDVEAEVFATTDYTNNNKLSNDLKRLAANRDVPHRFVFALVPNKNQKNPERFKPRKLDISCIKIKAFDLEDVKCLMTI